MLSNKATLMLKLLKGLHMYGYRVAQDNLLYDADLLHAFRYSNIVTHISTDIHGSYNPRFTTVQRKAPAYIEVTKVAFTLTGFAAHRRLDLKILQGVMSSFNKHLYKHKIALFKFVPDSKCFYNQQNTEYYLDKFLGSMFE